MVRKGKDDFFEFEVDYFDTFHVNDVLRNDLLCPLSLECHSFMFDTFSSDSIIHLWLLWGNGLNHLLFLLSRIGGVCRITSLKSHLSLLSFNFFDLELTSIHSCVSCFNLLIDKQCKRIFFDVGHELVIGKFVLETCAWGVIPLNYGHDFLHRKMGIRNFNQLAFLQKVQQLRDLEGDILFN